MAKATSGFERQVYYDAPGATATVKLLHVVKADVTGGNVRTETTDRGDGLSVPVHTEQVVQLDKKVSFSCRYFSDDAGVADLIVAADNGDDIAIKIVRYNGGPTEFDGDVTLNMSSPGGLTDGMEIEFECIASQDSGRKPVYA